MATRNSGSGRAITENHLTRETRIFPINYEPQADSASQGSNLVADRIDEEAPKQHDSLHTNNKDEKCYPRGARLSFLSAGLMAVVLIVAIDNYILGSSPCPDITVSQRMYDAYQSC